MFVGRCPSSGWPWSAYNTAYLLTKVMSGAMVSHILATFYQKKKVDFLWHLKCVHVTFVLYMLLAISIFSCSTYVCGFVYFLRFSIFMQLYFVVHFRGDSLGIIHVWATPIWECASERCAWFVGERRATASAFHVYYRCIYDHDQM